MVIIQKEMLELGVEPLSRDSFTCKKNEGFRKKKKKKVEGKGKISETEKVKGRRKKKKSDSTKME